MNLTIIHDTLGNIKGIIASPGDAVQAHMDLNPGQVEAQVDIPDLNLDASPEEIHRQLADIRQNYKVKVQAINSRLTRKSAD